MTKVPTPAVVSVLVAALSLCFSALAQTKTTDASEPAARLYQELGSVALDPSRVFHVRDASIARPGMEITMEDGTIAFTTDVMGRITGAFFEGDGELLITPPNAAERQSLTLFTNMAILEERFSSAYFRFNDNTAPEMSAGLRAPDDTAEFLDSSKDAAHTLAPADALRLLFTFSRGLPVSGQSPQTPALFDASDRFLHARLQGTTLGVFDVYYDSLSDEPIQVGQARKANDGTLYYDVWMSFAPPISREKDTAIKRDDAAFLQVDDISVNTHVRPPTEIEADATLKVKVRDAGARALIFELSRFVRVQSVDVEGRPVEFIHNPSVEGTQLARRGNDFVAVVLDHPSEAGKVLTLRFKYRGEVLADAGPGLLYVGARGNWYPNRGPVMANYDLEFYYPPGWTLVATGTPAPPTTTATALQSNEQVSHWVSDRPLPVAGFNLGKYARSIAHAGNITVESYGTGSVERSFPTAAATISDPSMVAPGGLQPQLGAVIPPAPPSPALNTQAVADAAAAAIRFYAERFGPYPYSHLALTQLPGPESQGWPSLVFLSSFAFLTDSQRDALHKGETAKILERQIPAHETAHQWWGDLISWRTYRDQWISEGLANYCSLMELEAKNPGAMQRVLEEYRLQLLKKQPNDKAVGSIGPVTLGARLASSQSPDAYEPILYGRGTWLIHMLRMMLRNAPARQGARGNASSDERFVRSLLNFRNKFEGKAATTQDLLASFEENLPPELQYEGKRSLDWFEHGWIEGMAIPRISLRAVKLTPKGTGLEAKGTIEQKDAPDDLVTAVPIYAVSASNSKILAGQVFADGNETSFQLNVPAGTKRLVLDPNRAILSDAR